MDNRTFSWKNALRVTGILLTIAVLAISTVVWIYSLKKDSTTPEVTYDFAIKSDKPLVVMFSSEWCGYCKKFMPTYNSLKDIYKDEYTFVVLEAEDPSAENLMRDYAIGGFPTIYIIDPKLDNRVLINNTLYGDIRKLRIELNRYLRIRAMIDDKKRR